MSSPDSPDHAQANPSEDLLLELESKKRNIISGVAALLESGTIVDEADRGILVSAVAFIENPTENYSDIKENTTNVGLVLCGYEMQGADFPPAIDDMHRYLLTLLCINRINFVEKELEQGSPDFPKIQDAMIWALDPATHLSKGYKDDTLLTAVNELQGRL